MDMRKEQNLKETLQSILGWKLMFAVSIWKEIEVRRKIHFLEPFLIDGLLVCEKAIVQEALVPYSFDSY